MTQSKDFFKNSNVSQNISNLKLSDSNKNIFTNLEIVKNYGTIYQTSGGPSDASKQIRQFVSKVLDSNSDLTNYLNLLGYQTLSPDTLFPVALIFGKPAFDKCVKYLKKQIDKNDKVPVIDAKLIDQYIDKSDVISMNISINTLVPVSFLMSIQKTYSNKVEQHGGNINRLFIGENVPPGNMEILYRYWNGQSIPNNIYAPLNSYAEKNRHFSFMNNELQTIPLSSSNDFSKPVKQNYGLQVEVPGISNQEHDSHSESHTETESMNNYSALNNSSSGTDILVIPNNMA